MKSAECVIEKIVNLKDLNEQLNAYEESDDEYVNQSGSRCSSARTASARKSKMKLKLTKSFKKVFLKHKSKYY
jgi:hypothetical protein